MVKTIYMENKTEEMKNLDIEQYYKTQETNHIVGSSRD